MNPPPTFHQALTAWKYAVIGKPAWQWPKEMAADSFEQFENWQAQLAATKIEANKKGYTCQFNKGGSKSGRCAAWVVANEKVFKIVYNAKGKRAQAVTATSRAAYKTVDLGERCEAVARAAIKLGACTDNDVGREIGMPANLVSGRRNNIEDAGGITIDGTVYVLRMAGYTKKDAVTQRSGNVWTLEKAAPQTSQLKREQATLFQ